MQPFPGPGGKWQISADGTKPVWARNGRERYFRNGRQIMGGDIQTEPSFAAGKPRLLFEGQFGPS